MRPFGRKTVIPPKRRKPQKYEERQNQFESPKSTGKDRNTVLAPLGANKQLMKLFMSLTSTYSDFLGLSVRPANTSLYYLCCNTSNLAFLDMYFFGGVSKPVFQKPLNKSTKYSNIFSNWLFPNSTYQELSKSVEKVTKILNVIK